MEQHAMKRKNSYKKSLIAIITISTFSTIVIADNDEKDNKTEMQLQQTVKSMKQEIKENVKQIKNLEKKLNDMSTHLTKVNQNKNATKNTNATSGLMVGAKTDPYWFQLGGAIVFEQKAFIGNDIAKGKEFHGGANFRNFEIDLNGGLGRQNLTYTLVTKYDTKEKKVGLDDAYVTYGITDKFTVSVGQVLPGFSLESTASSKWVPFFDRSMATHALGTDLGLGVNVSKWENQYTFIVAAMQPKQDREPTDGTPNSTYIKRDDRWQTNARFVYRPIFEGTKILQIGASGYFQDDHSATKQFKSHGEAQARHNTELLNTGYITASNHKGLDFEIAGQNGPLYGELEYERVFVTRPGGLDRLHFDGYHAVASYVLTGEAKTFKDFNGTFGQVKPACPKGAWEVAAKYSVLNLNNKDIQGGKANNVALGLNYYLNNNIKLSGEYTHSIQNPSQVTSVSSTFANTEKRKLNIFGLRMQAVF
jgi:phosphate-selective porin OprO/OprP